MQDRDDAMPAEDAEKGPAEGPERDSTKDVIAHAYTSILAEGGTKTITVKDVVERAGVSRMTFYYHFKDIYDLVDWIMRDYMERTLADAGTMAEVWRVLARDIVDLMDSDDLMVLESFRHLDPHILHRNVDRLFFEVAYAGLCRDERLDLYSDDDRRFLAHMMGYCLSGMMEDCMDPASDLDAADYIKRFNRIVVDRVLPSQREREEAVRREQERQARAHRSRW